MVTGIKVNKKILIVIWLLFFFKIYSQNSIGVGIGTASPKALLDIHSNDVTNGGILIPRYSIDDISTLTLESEHNSMLFYIQPSASGIMNGTGIATNVKSAGYYYYDSDSKLLIKLSSSKDMPSGWNIHGNNDVASTHFIGTLGNFPLKIKVNDTFSGFIGQENVALGYNSLNNLITTSTTGVNNIALGVNSVKNLTIGSDNISLGNNSLFSLIDGDDNIAIGNSVLMSTKSGRYNIGIGGRVLQDAVAGTKQNIGIGYRVLNKVATIEAFNIGIGYGVLEKGEGVTDNVVIGRSAAADLLTGSANVIIGRESMQHMTNGNNNVVIGFRSAEFLDKGDTNVIIGLESLQMAKEATGNIILGNRTASSMITGNNNIIIGNKAQPSTANISNEVTIGTPTMTSYRMWTNGWTNVSDISTKRDIKAVPLGLDFVKVLKPSEFIYKNETVAKKTYGFIAQDVQMALLQNNITDAGILQNFDNGTLGIRMNDFIPILTKAIQDQNVIITNQQKEIDQLKADIQAIKAAIGL